MMTQKVWKQPISFSVSPELREKLTQYAIDMKRSKSEIIEQFLLTMTPESANKLFLKITEEISKS